jgi:hypothetical protein
MECFKNSILSKEQSNQSLDSRQLTKTLLVHICSQNIDGLTLELEKDDVWITIFIFYKQLDVNQLN